MTDRARESASQKTNAVVRQGKAAASDLTMEDVLARFPLPHRPLDREWQVGLSTFVTGGRKPPRGTGILLNRLDIVGGITISPDEIGFDGDNAKWKKVRCFRTRTVDDMIATAVNESIVDTIAGFLPPVPGREWAVEKASGIFFTLLALSADKAIKNPETVGRQFIANVEYKGWIRTKEAETGLFSTPLMMLRPDLEALIREEAAERAVPIENAEPEVVFKNAEERAAWLSEMKEKLTFKRREAEERAEGAALPEGEQADAMEAQGIAQESMGKPIPQRAAPGNEG